MGTEAELLPVYWDASAVLSVIFEDSHSRNALDWAQRKGLHLISTLSYAETCAVVARMRRDRMLADILTEAALKTLDQGPWRRLHVGPQWGTVQSLSLKWALRGADLWHLATAKGLQEQLPELVLLTYDYKLEVAARGEGLGGRQS
jgi:predicted nucleic acid-binding protein